MEDLGESYITPLPMYCDNQVVIYIVQNSIFYERISILRWIFFLFVGRFLVEEFTLFLFLADVFTKPLITNFPIMCLKFVLFDIYAPA